ncbi:MAG: hypothetical protein BWY99_00398 [Synergistetes bacterium ADurb.BinA166]|nr:MAG: hypothetical protein BWY99_00398 [Synergistetes bacterium ADurb.BinA166]
MGAKKNMYSALRKIAAGMRSAVLKATRSGAKRLKGTLCRILNVTPVVPPPKRLAPVPYWSPGSPVWEHWRSHYGLTPDEAVRRWTRP